MILVCVAPVMPALAVTFRPIAVACAVLTGLSASLVLSTFPRPTSFLTMPVGVVRAGLVDKTTDPVPVEVVTPVPPFNTGSVPVMSAVERLIASQEEFVPSVCKYLFAWPVCAGSKAFKPVFAVV